MILRVCVNGVRVRARMCVDTSVLRHTTVATYFPTLLKQVSNFKHFSSLTNTKELPAFSIKIRPPQTHLTVVLM